ncbi:MAG: hypothetical protein ABSF46_07995 [Terriglobia bacterium]|jgi:hypothetical protein
MQVRGDFVQEHLDSISRREACGWCKHPFKDIYRSGLCRHCYKIKTELGALHQEVEHVKRAGKPYRGKVLISPSLKLAYMTALRMAEEAQWEGRKYGSLYNDDITSLDVQRELSFISKRFLKKDLYENCVYLFDCYNLSQKRNLLHILSMMSREYLRRKRRFRCRWEVVDKEIRHVLKGRFRGTYRVEKGYRRPAQTSDS